MADRADKAVSVKVRGRVQGVAFRWSTQTEAARLGVAGWVRNDLDGDTVTAHFEGDPAAVDQLVQWCHQGPPSARVRSVSTMDASAQGLTRFEVR